LSPAKQRTTLKTFLLSVISKVLRQAVKASRNINAESLQSVFNGCAWRQNIDSGIINTVFQKYKVKSLLKRINFFFFHLSRQAHDLTYTLTWMPHSNQNLCYFMLKHSKH